MLDADRINLSIHAQELRSISARLYRNDLMLECKNEFACPHVSVSAQSRSFREPARFGEQDGRTPKSVPMAHAGRTIDPQTSSHFVVQLEGAQKCFFRKSDGGREVLEGWSSGTASATSRLVTSEIQNEEVCLWLSVRCSCLAAWTEMLWADILQYP